MALLDYVGPCGMYDKVLLRDGAFLPGFEL
jgi:hypothetical protein